MKKHLLTTLAILAGISTIAAGCGQSDGPQAGPATTTTVAASTEPEITVPDDGGEAEDADFEDLTPEIPKAQQDADPNEVYLLALDNIQEFWDVYFPEVYGAPFTPIPSERIIPIPEDSETLETCNTGAIAYSDVQDNAVAINCDEGQMVAWDAEESGLMAITADQFGPLASAAILAHEFGHVVQFQSDTPLITPYSELQADCFAGAWVSAIAEDPPAGLEGFADPAAVDATLSAMITLRDPVGSSADAEGAHGNGFDRVRTFQDGYEGGPQECANYSDQPPTVTEVAFDDPEDEQTGGNLPFEELLPAATEDLDNYYSLLIDGWEPLGTLEVGDVDQEQLEFLDGLSTQIGDGAPLVFLGLGWAQSLQVILGQDEGRDETGQLLQASCIAGDWMAHMFFDVEGDPTYGSLTLSPGDLDEAILGLIAVASGEDGAEPGGTFELLSAFRQGVIQRIESCGLDS